MKKWYHLLFVVICGGVLLVLWNAPEVSTPRLPANEDHLEPKQFQACPRCHGAETEVPMPADHLLTTTGTVAPNHLKCYFCHKPTEE